MKIEVPEPQPWDNKPAIYWDDLRALIRENTASNAYVTYYRDRNSPQADKISVLDRNNPRRKGIYLTGMHEEDHFRDSLIGEAAWFNNMIPVHSYKGLRRDGKFIKQPYRGALPLLELLLAEGCLRRTDDLRHFFRKYGKRLP